MNLSLIGGRKFILSIVVLASATSMVWLEHISDGVYSAVVIATAGAYITGNVAQKINSSSNKEIK